MTIDIKEAARRHIAEKGLGSDEQTRIALFVMAIKSANTAVLAKLELQPVDWAPYSVLHQQFFKEMEIFTPLSKATRWSMNPLVYAQATQINQRFWLEAGIANYLLGPLGVDERFYNYLALSHAMLSVVRFVPLLPLDMSVDSDPFVASLSRLEVEGGRLIQSQIRFLKEMEISLERDAKERIIEQQHAIMSGIFDEFLRGFVGA